MVRFSRFASAAGPADFVLAGVVIGLAAVSAVDIASLRVRRLLRAGLIYVSYVSYNHFGRSRPRVRRDPTFTSLAGRAVLFGTMAVMVVSLIAVMTVVWRLIPWYAVVIGGGLAVLAAPPILQQCPDRFVDGRASLLSLAGAGAVLALLLLWLDANRVGVP